MPMNNETCMFGLCLLPKKMSGYVARFLLKTDHSISKSIVAKALHVINVQVTSAKFTFVNNNL